MNVDLCDLKANTEEGTPLRTIVEWWLDAGEVLRGLYQLPIPGG